MVIVSNCYVIIAFSQVQAIGQPDSVTGSAVEKVHLHLDRPFYIAGDTIWFKAYLVNASNALTDHSKVLTVELISETDLLLKSIKVPSLPASVGPTYLWIVN